MRSSRDFTYVALNSNCLAWECPPHGHRCGQSWTTASPRTLSCLVPRPLESGTPEGFSWHRSSSLALDSLPGHLPGTLSVEGGFALSVTTMLCSASSLGCFLSSRGTMGGGRLVRQRGKEDSVGLAVLKAGGQRSHFKQDRRPVSCPLQPV